MKTRMTLLGIVLVALAARAEIIDRIAVAIGNQVITEAGLMRAIRVTAFQNGTQPDFSPESKRKTADRLIEQKLVRKELELSRYPAPAQAEIEPVLQELVTKRFGSQEKFRAALATYGLTEQDIRDELLWQRTLLLFLAFRFQPAVQVTDQDIREYFEKRIVPEIRKADPARTVSVDEFRDQIELKLTGERADKELDQWLKEARKRNRIEYREDAFK